MTAGRLLWIAALLVVGAGTAGCQTLLDLERARGLVRTNGAVPEVPVLVEKPAAELPRVEGLVAVGEELRAVPLRWDPVLSGDVGGYAIERALVEEGSFERVGSVPGRYRTTWVDRGTDHSPKQEGSADLGDGHTYYYRVRAFDVDGHLAAAGEEAVAARTAEAPSPPERFQAFSQLPREVALRWTPSEDPRAAGYVVLRSPTARGEFLPLARLTGRFATTYLDEGLGDLRVFYYRIAAVNAAGGQGEPTRARRAVTKPEPLPPIGLAVTGQALGSNQLSWTANVEPDLRAYRLLRRRAEGEPEEVAMIPADANQARDDQVGAGEPVAYRLVAVDRDGLESGASAEIEVESVGYEATARVRDGAVELAWSPEVQAGFAEARVLQIGTFGTRELGRTKEPGFAVSEVQPGRSYRFRVVGIREDGSEAPSSREVAVEVPEADSSGP